jgi:ABC-type dipeptide/oligopeptide/nickel transport system ATPase subunit
VVDRFASELAEAMRDELSRYATQSRRQEKVLPSQIVEAMQQLPQPAPETLADEVDDLRTRVRELADSLTRVGLFQEEDPDQRFVDYPRDNASILLAIREVYRVTLDRLLRLTEMRADLELFSNFMNERLTHKSIELNQRRGIEIALDRTGRIAPSQLSSGEQQLLALAFELLFRTASHSVVLLDEPELSLHVGWLQGLMSSFLEMGESRGLQFVVATHSGSVLAGHQELERSLDDVGTG